MKAKDFLIWCCNCQIEFVGVGHVELDENYAEQGEFLERFFGVRPLKTIDSGDYFYIYDDVVEPNDLQKIADKAELILNRDGDNIYLFRIED